jgi:hypothetical protein
MGRFFETFSLSKRIIAIGSFSKKGGILDE